MRPRSEALLDTIAALATPLARSALAVVRVSGSNALRVLGAVVPGVASFEPRHARLVDFVETTGERIDRGLVTFFPAPGSFTGEDVAELSVHGSPVLVERILCALFAAGARAARPGEFTERALRFGKIDLVEAEAIRDLIESRTVAATRASTRRLEGRLSERLEKIRAGLLEAACDLAATIDFSDDVGEKVPERARVRLDESRQELLRLAATYETGRLLSAGCRVAILGLPNAGKSTLFNALVGSARAIVTEIPGTTRDTVEATIDVSGVPVVLIDTAGLRQTEDVVERLGVQRAREAAQSADAILYVFDAGSGWSEQDALALTPLEGRSVMVVANKIDRVDQSRRPLPPGALSLCGLSSEAGGRLRAWLGRTLAAQVDADSASEVLGSLRQRDLVLRAAGAAAAAVDALDHDIPPEYAATHVAESMDALADLVGETTPEDVLQKIFATFCIGK